MVAGMSTVHDCTDALMTLHIDSGPGQRRQRFGVKD